MARPKRPHSKASKKTETKPTEPKPKTQAPPQSTSEYAKKWLKDPSPTPDTQDPDAPVENPKNPVIIHEASPSQSGTRGPLERFFLSASDYAEKWLKDLSPIPDSFPAKEPEPLIESPKSLETVHKNPPSQWGTLGVLPQEALDMIYEPLFAANDIAMTRVSKTYAENTKTALYRSAKYRTHIRPLSVPNPRGKKGSRPWTTVIDPAFPSTYLAQVRHLKISLTPHWLGGFGVYWTTMPEKYSDLVAKLVRSVTDCRNLEIELEGHGLALDITIGKAELLERLDTLTLTWSDSRVGKRSCVLDLRENQSDCPQPRQDVSLYHICLMAGLNDFVCIIEALRGNNARFRETL
ncbi:MAG: hypothetical protein Q9195_006109 [Heterodermia aff. obscurata]